MRYHNITMDDMKNGDGLRTVLWVSGCNHRCKGCHNQVTWDPNDGLVFDDAAKNELFTNLGKEYISGLTISGGDPLMPENIADVLDVVREVKRRFPDKTIWIYTGDIWEDMCGTQSYAELLQLIDVLVDGEFIEDLADVKHPWAGSTNQRVIDVRKSLNTRRIELYETI